MGNANLSDDNWSEIQAFIKTQNGIYVGKEEDCRNFVEAVLWVLRSGAHWQLMPSVDFQNILKPGIFFANYLDRFTFDETFGN